jgi:hypothetical protein
VSNRELISVTSSTAKLIELPNRQGTPAFAGQFSRTLKQDWAEIATCHVQALIALNVRKNFHSFIALARQGADSEGPVVHVADDRSKYESTDSRAGFDLRL